MESFTEAVLSLVRSLVHEVGEDHASLKVEKGEPRGFALRVRLEPHNVRSANFRIGVDDVAGVQVYMGQGCMWESDACSKDSERVRCLEFLEALFRAVMSGGFEEVAWFARDKSGHERVVSAKGLVKLSDRVLRFRTGLPGFPIPFLRTTKREFRYEPYG